MEYLSIILNLKLKYKYFLNYLNLFVLSHKWWKSHEQDFPKLAIMAKHYLCIPATSAASERNFSIAGLLLQERRSCLKVDNVDDLLFLHKNL